MAANIAPTALDSSEGSNAPRVRSGEVVLRRVRSTVRSYRIARERRSVHRAPTCDYISMSAAASRRASSFAALVRETALRVGVEPRALAVRALLHLPRVASYKGWVTRWQAQRELRISAERLRGDARAARNHLPVEKFSLRELAFEVIDPSRAAPALNVASLPSERSSGFSLLRAGRSDRQAPG